MKAFVLAGGLGTRLRPLTFTRPKHLLPIANRPHIEHVFDLLLHHDIRHVVMLTSYLSEAFEPVFARARSKGLEVDLTLEDEPLGTAGAFKNAEALVGGERFLAFNGDVLTDVDLSAVVDRHVSDGAEASILLTPVDDPSAFGVVPTDDNGRVQGFIEKPPREEAPTNLINAGVYVFEPSVLDRIPPGEVWSAERQLFPDLVEQKANVFAHGTDAYWMDIGTPEKYLAANLDALAGRYRTPAAANLADGNLFDEDVHIDHSATVVRSTFGRGVKVGVGAVVHESVALPGASIGAGARVRRSILGEKVTIEPGVEIGERAIGDGETA
jgi:mannose-1-phosphate guanylyltransferase